MATEEIQDYADQLDDLIRKIRSSLDSEVPQLQGKAKLDKLDYLKGRVDRLKQVFSSYKVELRELSRADAHEFEMRARDYEVTIAGLQSELTDVRSRSDRDNQFTGGKTVSEMTNKEIAQAAKNVQTESKTSTERALGMVNDAIKTGIETTKQLKEQTEQLNRIDRGVDVVDSNVQEAEKAFRQLVRRLATDRIIMTFVLLVILGVIAAIIVGILRARGVIGAKPTPTPTAVSGSRGLWFLLFDE